MQAREPMAGVKFECVYIFFQKFFEENVTACVIALKMQKPNSWNLIAWRKYWLILPSQLRILTYKSTSKVINFYVVFLAQYIFFVITINSSVKSVKQLAGENPDTFPLSAFHLSKTNFVNTHFMFLDI